MFLYLKFKVYLYREPQNELTIYDEDEDPENMQPAKAFCWRQQ